MEQVAALLMLTSIKTLKMKNHEKVVYFIAILKADSVSQRIFFIVPYITMKTL